jgi:uncharacterized protein
VTAAERIVLLDMLRGVALFGILLVNFNSDYFVVRSPLDRAAGLAIGFLAEGSFYPLFSFLFGLGFSLQVARLSARGTPVVRTYLRRLAALYGIAVLHSTLLWQGDVLRTYAAAGVPLLFARRLSTRSLIFAVVVCLALTVKPEFITSPLTRLTQAVTADSGSAQRQASHREALDREEHRAIRGGTYGQLVRVRIQILRYQIQAPLESIHFQILAMFLLGMLAGRTGLLVRPAAYLSLIRSAMWIGLLVGVLGNYIGLVEPILEGRGLHMVPARVMDFKAVFQLVGDSGLSLFYASGLTILVTLREKWRRWMMRIGQVGRMALTNYLLQSLIMLLLMCGFGLGLVDHIGLAGSVPLKVALFVAEIAMSGWWLRRFRFGPAEWLWRAATYGSLPSLRLGSPTVSTDVR